MEVNDKSDLARVYEASFQVPAALGEEGALSVFERIKKFVTSEGTVIAEGTPRRATLASEMEMERNGKKERHTEGFFSWIKFEASPEAAPALEALLKKDVDVLRSFVIKTTRESGPSPRFLSSDRLEGETIRKRETAETGKGPVSEDELNKSIEHLVGQSA